MKKIFIPLVIILMLTGFSSKPGDLLYQNKPADIITMQSDELVYQTFLDTFLIGLWEGLTIDEGEEIAVKLELLPEGKSRIRIKWIEDSLETDWLTGTYEIDWRFLYKTSTDYVQYGEVLVVMTNDVEIIYSFNIEEQTLYFGLGAYPNAYVYHSFNKYAGSRPNRLYKQ